MELLKEFEGDGGLFIEEATDEVLVTYGFDGATSSLRNGNQEDMKGAKRPAPEVSREEDDVAAEKAEAKRRKKQKAKKKVENKAKAEAFEKAKEKVMDAADYINAKAKEEDLASENVKLKQELAELKGEPATSADVPDLPHWREFELDPALMKNIARLGFLKPTEVQARCLTPAIRQRKDIVGAAETGSGKTLAFGLPILHHTLGSLDLSSSSTAPAQGGQQESADGLPKGMRDLKALMILPTRELAVQVRKHLNDASEGTLVRAEALVGGMSLQKQRRLLNRRPQIVVGTPGRIHQLLGLGEESANDRHDWLRDSLVGLRHLVLDEADRLVEDGHFRELDKILELVYSSVARPQQLQTFVFSATLTLNPHQSFKKNKKHHDDSGVGKVEKLGERLKFREARAVHIVDLNGPIGAGQAAINPGDVAAKPTKKGLLPEQLVLREAICNDDKDKEAMLMVFLLQRWRWEHAADLEAGTAGSDKGEGRVLIFCNAISSVLRLTPVLALLMESPAADHVLAKVKMNQNNQTKGNQHPGPVVQVLGLHSRMRQKDRLKRIEKFRNSKNAVLVCTDVAARGLDVKMVTTVLHFQAPRNPESFVHRSGRTARAGQKGESIAFVAPTEHQQWQKLYRNSGIEKERVQNFNADAFQLSAGREASRLVFELESKVHRLAKECGDRSWMRKAADEAELMMSDDDGEENEDAAVRRKLMMMWEQLQARVRRQPKRMHGAPIGKRRKL